jgi:hypothetical protein
MTSIASLTTREYFSGSCTLRITGQLSPLSQVANKPVMVRSRFNLQLLPEHELDEPITSSPGTVFSPRLELSGKAEQLSVLAAIINRYVQGQLTLANATGPSASVRDTQGGISLQPLGLTRHRLVLPPDFRPNQESNVELSALELADLADVLAQADSDLYLPTGEDLPRRRSSRPKLPIWLGSAVAVGIAAILGSQWLSLQTPLTHLPTATREGDIALEDNQELESLSQAPAQEPAGAPPPETEASLDRPNPDIAEEQQPAAGPETVLESVPPANIQPAPGTSPGPVPSRTESVESPAAMRAPAPQPGAATPRPQTRTEPAIPETATPGQAQPPAIADDGSEPPVRAPSVARNEDIGEAEAFSEPAPSPAPLSLPETTNNAEVSGDAPEQRTAGQSLATADASSPWQEQLRQQLQQNWAPIPNQSEPLRYRLTINQEGTLQSIIPLSARSQQQQEALNLPQTGEPVPQFPTGVASVLEVQFLPSGEVIIVPVTSPAPDTQE